MQGPPLAALTAMGAASERVEPGFATISNQEAHMPSGDQTPSPWPGQTYEADWRAPEACSLDKPRPTGDSLSNTTCALRTATKQWDRADAERWETV